mmetsp:Transcript_37058/g.48703  ORF Transcript_37058/g.48703 Transcript_37058/m.48703 type:complete len:100 (+) Transcript_37058:264-563(+)
MTRVEPLGALINGKQRLELLVYLISFIFKLALLVLESLHSDAHLLLMLLLHGEPLPWTYQRRLSVLDNSCWAACLRPTPAVLQLDVKLSLASEHRLGDP